MDIDSIIEMAKTGDAYQIKLSDEDYEFISSLEQFDLEMLLSEIHHHGWDVAEVTLGIMREALDA